jgi:ABC-type glutathione transport system ATPase component
MFTRRNFMLDEFKEVLMATDTAANKNGKNGRKKTDPLLVINDLHVWYELRRFGFGHAGYVKAVDGVSFRLEEGETVAVVGESGCGKSSLMKTILGLNIPTSGEVVFDDENLSELNGNGLRDYRFKIGYVQQDPYGALPPFMNVQKILADSQSDERGQIASGGGLPAKISAHVERWSAAADRDRPRHVARAQADRGG